MALRNRTGRGCARRTGAISGGQRARLLVAVAYRRHRSMGKSMEDRARPGQPSVLVEEFPDHRVLRVRLDLLVRRVMPGRKDYPVLPDLKAIQVHRGRKGR